ncbi:MAG: DUF1289 domain-containing protein [Gammaproteobacteria bacterium]|nr:MAG: DUF1289 domain-containing protein [Gammaproteobacteria bacterium]
MKAPEANATPQSPCIRNCCLDAHDICLGCFRHIDEITGWNSFSEQEKERVLTVIHARKEAHSIQYPSFK